MSYFVFYVKNKIYYSTCPIVLTLVNVVQKSRYQSTACHVVQHVVIIQHVAPTVPDANLVHLHILYDICPSGTNRQLTVIEPSAERRHLGRRTV